MHAVADSVAANEPAEQAMHPLGVTYDPGAHVAGTGVVVGVVEPPHTD